MTEMLRKWLLFGLVIVLLVSFGAVIGCGSEESDVEVTAGKYVNQDDASEYFELEADGTFHSPGEEGKTYTGTWEVKGNLIIWTMGDFQGGGIVEGNIITDADGAIWVLED